MNISSEYSLWLIIPCLLLGGIYAAILYYKNQKDELSTRLCRWLAALRTITVAFIAFLLIGPLIHSEQYTDVQPTIVVALDGSSSMNNALPDEQKSLLINDLREIETALSDQFDVQFCTFGAEVTPALPDSFDQPQTNMGKLFEQVDIQYANDNLGALVVVSDGINNTGIDPIYAAHHLSVPMVTMTVGDTTRTVDVAIAKITANRKSFKNNRFPIRVLVSGTMAGGQKTTLRLKKGERVIEEQPIIIRNDRFTTTHIFYPDADSVGLQRFTVEIDGVAQESNLDNNRQTVVVEVLERRQKVLMIAHAPHPDIAALRSVLEENIAFEVSVETAAEAKLSPKEFDLVILHQLPSLAYPMETLLEQCFETRTPILFVIGQNTNFSRFNQLRTGLTIQQERQLTEDAVPSFNHAFRAFQTEEFVAEDSRSWTPLRVPFGDYKLSTSASVLFHQRIGNVITDFPLVAFNQTASGRFGFVCGEGIWRWRLEAYKRLGNSRTVNEMLLKISQFLASDEKNQRFRVTCDNQFATHHRIVFKAELYNELFEPITTEAVHLLLRNDNGLEYNYMMGIEGNNYKLDLGTFPAGNYHWEAGTQVDWERLSDRGNFIVTTTNIENEQHTADAALMEKLATSHQGTSFFWQPKSRQVIDYVKDNISAKSTRYTTTGYYELIKLPWLLFAIAFLLCLEWFLRKFHGSY